MAHGKVERLMQKRGTFALVVQGEGVQVKVSGQGRKHARGKRGAVRHFSTASRRRLLRYFAAVEWGKRKGVFLTLTYGQNFPNPDEAKVHLDTLLKRVARKFPNAAAIWRMEFQERGAPHFHLIFINLPYWDKADVKKVWGEIIGREYWDTKRNEPPFTRIELIRGKRKAWSYLSKYVGKVSGSGFNSVSYLTAEGEFLNLCTGEVSPIGRYWGVFNRALMPLAEVFEVVMKWRGQIYAELVRHARRIWSGAGKFGGFYIYSKDSVKWLALLELLKGNYYDRVQALRQLRQQNIHRNACAV